MQEFQLEYERQRQRKLQQLRDIQRQKVDRMKLHMQKTVSQKEEIQRECAQLRGSIMESEAQNRRLTDQLQQQHKTSNQIVLLNTMLKNEIENAQQQLSGINQQLSHTNAIIAQYERKILQLQSTVTKLNNQLQQSQKTHQKQSDYLRGQFQEKMKSAQQKHTKRLQAKEQQLRHMEKLGQLKLTQTIEQLSRVIDGKNEEKGKEVRTYQLQNRRLLEENKRLNAQVVNLKQINLDLDQKLSNEAIGARMKTRERDYEMESLRKQLDFQKGQRKQEKARLKAAIEDREYLRKQVEQARVRSKQDMRALRQSMQQKLQEYLREAQKASKSTQKRTTQLLTDNKQLSELCNTLKKQKEQLQEQLNKQYSSQQVKQRRDKQADNKQIQKLQRLLAKKQLELADAEKQLKATKTKMDRILAKFDEMLTKRNQIEKENKMLLSEIVFWRDRNKQAKAEGNSTRKLEEIRSDESRQVEDPKAELQTYKALIKQMEQDMTLAVQKLDAKNEYITQLQRIVMNRQQPLPVNEKNPLQKRISNESIFSVPKYEQFERILDQP